MNNMEPEKKDVWEEKFADIWHNGIADAVLEYAYSEGYEKPMEYPTKKYLELLNFIRQNFIPRAELVEKIEKLAYLSDDLGGGKAVSLDDLLDLIKNNE